MNSLSNWPLWLAGAVVLLVLADLAVHLLYALLLVRRFQLPPEFKVQPAPVDGPPFEPLKIPTTDGLFLAGGAYYPHDGHPIGVVVFCPETGGRFDTAENYLTSLIDAGFAVVSFSFRNQAPSDTLPGYRATHWVSNYEVTDVHAVLDFVGSQPQFAGLPVGLAGVSRGAGAALAAGATRPEVKGVWAQGAFSTQALSLHYSMTRIRPLVGDWGHFIPVWHIATTLWFVQRIAETQLHARLIRMEKYLPLWKGRSARFVCGSRDTYVPSVLAQQLCQKSGHAPDEDCWVVQGAKHNQERNAGPREYDSRLIRFFQQAMDRQPVSAGPAGPHSRKSSSMTV